MYVRALSKHSYGCYMLQLLPDGVGEKTLRLLFSLAPCTPSCKTKRETQRDPAIDFKCKFYQFTPATDTKVLNAAYPASTVVHVLFTLLKKTAFLQDVFVF